MSRGTHAAKETGQRSGARKSDLRSCPAVAGKSCLLLSTKLTGCKLTRPGMHQPRRGFWFGRRGNGAPTEPTIRVNCDASRRVYSYATILSRFFARFPTLHAPTHFRASPFSPLTHRWIVRAALGPGLTRSREFPPFCPPWAALDLVTIREKLVSRFRTVIANFLFLK